MDTAQSVLAELIIQHEVLRTQLQEGHLPARPTIVDETEVPVVATELPEGSTEPIVEAHLIKANAAPFILNEQPLLRSELVRVASEGDAGRFWWLITLHHLIADRASMMQLADEIAAKLRGDSVPPPEIHYADYVDWQRNLPADALEPLLFYWKWQLRGRLPPLELPTARPRMAVHSFTADRHTFSWGPSLTHSLRDLARNPTEILLQPNQPGAVPVIQIGVGHLRFNFGLFSLKFCDVLFHTLNLLAQRGKCLTLLGSLFTLFALVDGRRWRRRWDNFLDLGRRRFTGFLDTRQQ